MRPDPSCFARQECGMTEGELIRTNQIAAGPGHPAEGESDHRFSRRDLLPGAGIIVIPGAFGGRFLKMAQMPRADAAMTKPVSADLLLARVAEALKPRR